MRTRNSSIKKHKADERAKKRREKFENRLERKKNPKRDFESMIAYTDKFGNILSEPPVEKEPEDLNQNSEKEDETTHE